jgi:nucleoside-diphosphate-sugar epimerase
MRNLLIIGAGYTGRATALLARSRGWQVALTTRGRPGPGEVSFADPAPLAQATHLLVTAPPGEAGDPVWVAHAGALRAAAFEWVGYLSTTGVYGDRGGATVDEDTPPAPQQPRSHRRLEAERQWQALPCAVDVFRVGGIYGPGRSALDDARAGTARRIVKPGHSFSRIHRDDIAQACLAAAERPDGHRILHLVDDEAAAAAQVAEEAARLLGLPAPPEVPFAEASARMSEMARSFWSENRRVASTRTKAALGIAWRYPTFREGLAAILAEEGAEERAEDAAQQREV